MGKPHEAAPPYPYLTGESSKHLTKVELLRALKLRSAARPELACGRVQQLKIWHDARLDVQAEHYCNFPEGLVASVAALAGTGVLSDTISPNDPCTFQALPNNPEEGSETGDSRVVALRKAFKDLCSKESQPTALSPVDSILSFAVGGLGDFLKERAKQEAVAYAATVLGREVCDPNSDVHKFLAPFGEDAFPFKRSCSSAFPRGLEVDYAAFADGRFQRAFKADLADLPGALLDVALQYALRDPKQKNLQFVLRVMGHAVVHELEPLIKGGHFDPATPFHDVDARILATMGKQAPTLGCRTLVNGTGLSVECSLLLGLRLGAKVEQHLGDSILDEASIVRETAESFCRDFSSDTKCLGFDPASTSALNGALDRVALLSEKQATGLIDAADFRSAPIVPELIPELVMLVSRYREASEAIRSTSSTSDASKKVDGILAGLRIAVDATVNFARRREVGDSKVEEAVGDAFDAMAAAVDSGFAFAKGDLSSGIVALKAVVGVPSVQAALGPKGVRAVGFVLSVAGAKDSAAAKQAIEEAAEPLGSYRGKYESNFVLTVNGFVGPAAGGKLLLNSSRPGLPTRLEPRPLTALLGLDFSWRASNQHVGFTLTAIDALGMLSIEDGSKTHIDWGAVVTPGVMLRWGVCRSPVVVFASGQYQPLRTPDSDSEASGTAVPYKGAVAILGGVAIDIPILTLHAQ